MIQSTFNGQIGAIEKIFYEKRRMQLCGLGGFHGSWDKWKVSLITENMERSEECKKASKQMVQCHQRHRMGTDVQRSSSPQGLEYESHVKK